MDGFCKVIKEVHIASGLPVIADADTGFGEGEMCAKTVWDYYMNGAAGSIPSDWTTTFIILKYFLKILLLLCITYTLFVGLHLEDQVFPKRCGHLDGKTLISAEDMAKKIQIAAQASQECSDGEFVVCARTDARGVYGIDETIRRSKMYIDAGADMIFPEGLATKEEFQTVAQELKGYGKKGGPFLLANMTEFGKTPIINLSEFEKMGYNCVIFPVSTLRIAMKAVDDFLKSLKATGDVNASLQK